MASLSGLARGPGPSVPHPTGRRAERWGGPSPKDAWAFRRVKGSWEGGQALRKAAWRADLVLEAPREVAHEEVGLVALYLSVLHRPLPKQGVEVHRQHSAGALLIPGGLLAWGSGRGRTRPVRPMLAPGPQGPPWPQPLTYPQVQVGELFRAIVQH